MSGVPSKDYPYRVKAEHYKSIISTMDSTGSHVYSFLETPSKESFAP